MPFAIPASMPTKAPWPEAFPASAGAAAAATNAIPKIAAVNRLIESLPRCGCPSLHRIRDDLHDIHRLNFLLDALRLESVVDHRHAERTGDSDRIRVGLQRLLD